jgi:hypothetical protein
VSAQGIDILRRFTDDRIAELSAELLDAGRLDGIELLANNYRPGQYDRVRHLLPAKADDDHAHRLAMDIIASCRPDPRIEAVDCLLWVYERSPCSFCRNSVVDDLIRLDRLPASLAAECHDDCASETREAVSRPSGG